MFRILFLASVFATSAASAACPDMNSLSRQVLSGTTTLTEFYEGNLCILDRVSADSGNPKLACAPRIALREELVKIALDMFSVGELTQTELELARVQADQLKTTCGTN